MISRASLACAVVLAFGSAARAQTSAPSPPAGAEAIEPDRPDVTNGAHMPSWVGEPLS